MEPTFFTVFTSTYNRKHTIDRVWDSLINQTNKNFEWIVIENGSEDNIKPLLEDYKSKADFEVRIVYQDNQGRFMAFNKAVDMARGELFVPADSDDSFDYNTIDRFSEIWSQYKSDNISGINVLCKYEDGTIVGDKYPTEGISTYTDILYKHKVSGEKWGCVRVDILRKYKFPIITDTKILPDSYIWAKIGFNYEAVYINEPLRLYYLDAGNQLTTNKKIRKKIEYYKMKYDFTIWEINYVFPKISKYLSFKDYIKKLGYLWVTTFKSKNSIIPTLKSLETLKSRTVALLLLLPSFIMSKFR